MDHRRLLVFLITATVLAMGGCTSTSVPVDLSAVTKETLPNGDSVDLVALHPIPGTAIAPGEQVTFTITARYTLASAPKARIVLVLQDEGNESLAPEQNQVRHDVVMGTGTVTLSDSVAVTRTAKLVEMFILLVPDGAKSTRPAYVLRWPIAN